MIENDKLKTVEYILDDESVWSRGVILQDNEENRAMVEEDGNNRLVRINTSGIDSRGLMAVIMNQLKNIHDTYPGIKVARQVPCQCDRCRNNPEPTIFPYDKLIKWLRDGETEVYCNEGRQFLEIKKILFNVGITVNKQHTSHDTFCKDDRPVPRQKRQPLKVFLSYSQEDTPDAQKLLRYLKKFEKQGLIKLWYDRMIPPGDEWDDEIKSKLSGSDIILLLLSLEFLSTDYVIEIEIPLACKKHENNTAVVIPIILRPCTWEDDFPEVSKLLALPDKAKPLSKWEDKDDAWVAVINGIRKVIRERDEKHTL